jgi:predicted GNAT family N-acyltransferase
VTGASVAGPADRTEIAALRTRVFVEEQGVPPEIEQDAADETAVHAVSRDVSGRIVATGRLLLRKDGGPATIGRMATDAAARGGGHGAAVLAELHRQAALRGATDVELHAQVSARGFYERAGYTAVCEEAGIAHVTMRRLLTTAEGASQRGTSEERTEGRSVVPDSRARGGTHVTDRSGRVETRSVRPSE